MLFIWKKREGPDATYEALYDALTDQLVQCQHLADEICCNHGNFTDDPPSKRQYLATNTQRPQKVHWEHNVNPYVKALDEQLSVFAIPGKSLYGAENSVKSRKSEEENRGDDFRPILQDPFKTSRKEGKREVSALSKLPKSLTHVMKAKNHRDDFRPILQDPFKTSRKEGKREVLGEPSIVFVQPGESSRDAKSSLKRGHSGKECHGDEVLSLFASSGRSLFYIGGSAQKGNSLKENHGVAPTEWKQGRLLGAGGFGKVYQCIPIGCSVNSGSRLAVKEVKMEPQYTEMTEEVKAIKNEINILENLKHERIVSFHGSEQKGGYLYLFMEYMPGGSLSEHIKAHKVLFENDSKRYTKQILEGLSFLHAKKIIHRDIKGSNVLLDGEGNVKLADFGLSKIIQEIGSKTDLVSYCGTPYWTAPEIMHGKGYGRKADIWSVGCTVVEMLTGRPPLYHLEPMAAIFQIGSNPTEPKLPDTVSQDAKQFVQASLTWDPSKRPSSEDLLKHNFIVDSSDW